MNKREFIKKSSVGALGIMVAPSLLKGAPFKERLRTAHIGVGNMGAADLSAISSHGSVDVVALCDVDAVNLSAARGSVTSPHGDRQPPPTGIGSLPHGDR